jgi:hypothetical protein
VIAQAAAAAQANPSPGGLFMLVWGLGASVYGLLIVANVRGSADKAARRWPAPARRRRPSPRQSQRTVDDPVEQTRRIRRIAIPFRAGSCYAGGGRWSSGRMKVPLPCEIRT